MNQFTGGDREGEEGLFYWHVNRLMICADHHPLYCQVTTSGRDRNADIIVIIKLITAVVDK